MAETGGALQLAPQIMNMRRRTAAFAVICTRVYRADIRLMVIGAPDMVGGGVAVDVARKTWFDGRDVTRDKGAIAFRRAGNVLSDVPG